MVSLIPTQKGGYRRMRETSLGGTFLELEVTAWDRGMINYSTNTFFLLLC